MPGTKEIKERIKSVSDTRKITNAMYLISSTKMRKAKSELDKTRPYFDALSTEIKRVFRTAENIESRFFYPPKGEPELNGTYGVLVVTADKGLAGSYNMNAIRAAEERLKKHPDTKLFVVGEYGRRYFESHGIPIEKSFLYTAQNPTMRRAREICVHLLDMYYKDELQKIYVVYTDMKNSLETEAVTTRLLPLHRSDFKSPAHEETIRQPFEFVPSMEAVLDNIVPGYISGFIYSALVASFCSEQNARMTAMDSANRNAEKILDDLRVQYNRVRQAGITQEITEVSAGARAVKK